MFLEDRFGRKHTYLRISLTESCNFQCLYCLPPEGLPEAPLPASYSTDDEICRLVEIFVQLGVRKIRLSGGEPLLRKGTPALIKRLRQTFQIPVTLTSNGSLILRYSKELLESGLSGINISLDSLNPKQFKQKTQSSSFEKVIQGIRLMAEAQIPLKLNAVVQDSFPLQEALDLIAFAQEVQAEMRFIEFMPLCGTGWTNKGVGVILQLEKELIEHLQMVDYCQGEVAHTYKIPGKESRIGFISSLSQPFCSTCNRIRLSCTGVLYSCLFSRNGSDLLTPLRQGASVESLSQQIQETVWGKTKAHGSDTPILFRQLQTPEKVISGLIHSIGG
jgi:cyclic pyranopterin phosphate synthase